jgi:puromycin-sensitive aminopeptidase
MSTVTRLLDAITPATYELTIEPNLSDFTFIATETIEFELVQASSSLTFHAVDLNIMVATVDGTQAAQSPLIDAAAQTVSFNFAHELAAGKHTLRLQLRGTIGEGLHGFYRSRYKHKGQDRWLATTQFEAVHAREAFVCIDEPSAKAIFKLKLIIDEALSAIANTNVLNETIKGGRKHLTFAPTPKMSTYLVAYIIGELEYVETTTANQTLIRVYATPGKQAQLTFALDTATKVLTFFEDYFDIPYPLPKLDMIAIPDFGAGAMENWGLVTYRETALLLEAASASRSNRQRVVEVIAHELAHQWFGNLVTMAWWNDLWLNEGFASWIEVLAQDKLFPEWQIWSQFVASDIARAMDLDALANTHPIEVEVNDPRELDEIFDAISYAKGASIIHMLFHYLNEDTFRDGLRIYLKRHAYGNTTTADLWAALTEASKQPVATVVGTWTSQSGFPLVEIKNERVSQSRFFASPHERKLDKSGLIWPIPLMGLTAQGVTSPRLFATKDDKAEQLSDTIKLNPGQSGFYRTLYKAEQIKDLTPLLTKANLPAVDRYGIVSDVYATTSAALTGSEVALALTESLAQETDYIVWGAVSGGFMSLLNLLPDDETRQKAELFGRWLVKFNYQRLGWTAKKNESYFDSLMRSIVLQQATRFEDPRAITEAREQFNNYIAGTAQIDPDLRLGIYVAIARSGDSQDFESLLERYKKEEGVQEKLRFKQPELTSRILELSLDPNIVRSQDTIFVLADTLMARYSRAQAWAFIQEHWDEFVDRYGGGGHMLDHVPVYLGMAFTTHAEAQELKTFFTTHPHPSITRPVAQAVEAITQRADWYQRDRAAITAFFDTWQAPKSG